MKVSFVKGDPARDDSLAPEDAELIGRLRAEIEAWKPRRGPDLRDLMVRVGPIRNLWVFYPAMSVLLIAVLIGAFLVMTTLGIGSLGTHPVNANLGR